LDERRYERPPGRLEFGMTVWCPKCKGRGTVTIKENDKTCSRCNGYGVVPNKGVVKVATKP
jgi:DnaJ-class molecular chaperone